MTVPIRNIYYLLCYVWDYAESTDFIDLESIDSPETIDLLATVLANGTLHLLKHGLDREYVEFEEQVTGVRGKILLGATTKTHALLQGKTVCALDDLSVDVLQNQILISTIERIIQLNVIDSKIDAKLRLIRSRMPPITRRRVETRDFSRVILHRNNRIYRLLLHTCRLIHDNLIPSDEPGQNRFLDFANDELKMDALFEKFLKRFYQREQSQFNSVGSESYPWQSVSSRTDSIGMLPWLKTDVSLKNAQEHVIIEAKFYAKPLQGSQYHAEKIRPDHIRQVYSYLQNAQRRYSNTPIVRGLLLYATSGQQFEHHYVIHGFPIVVAAVDLAQPWQQIHNRLIYLLECKPMLASIA